MKMERRARHALIPPGLDLAWAFFGALLTAAVLLTHVTAHAQEHQLLILEDRLHLRQTDEREWSTFPEEPNAVLLDLKFVVEDPERFATLRWLQEDVRRRWSVQLNGTEIASLVDDEAPMTNLASISRGMLREGENRLVVSSNATEPDDIWLGPIALLEEDRETLLSQARLDIEIVDETGNLIPGRITVVDENGGLAPLRADSSRHLAFRTGIVYTATGKASISLATDSYRLYASRGASYEADSAVVRLVHGARIPVSFMLREVARPEGYVSLDPHVHTLELSGHGDATLAERAVTAVGEGLDGMVLTEHNLNATIAGSPGALDAALVIPGNEYTTPRGHFSIFPVDTASAVPDPDVSSWAEVANRTSGAQVIVLNHGRDVHAGFAPLAPERFLQLSGERLDGESLPANAMEVWNSSAQRSDPFQLFRDWLALANRGVVLAPIGSSDSHDVGRYLVGQARTWVHCITCDGSLSDLVVLSDAIQRGRIAPSMGLAVVVEANDRQVMGAVVSARDSLRLTARLLGPSWIQADSLTLFVNGVEEKTWMIAQPRAGGVKMELHWTMPPPVNDASVAFLATGPDPDLPFWSIPKPYQRTSDEITARVAGASGLIRLDADGDGAWTSPFEQAMTLVEAARDLGSLTQRLEAYHPAVSVQVASILVAKGMFDEAYELEEALSQAAPSIRNAFARYRESRSTALRR